MKLDKKILDSVYIKEHPATLLKKTYEYMEKNRWLFGIFSIEVTELVSKVGPNTPVYAEFIKGYLTVKLWAECIEEDNLYVEKLIELIKEDYDNHVLRMKDNDSSPLSLAFKAIDNMI